MRVRFGRRRFQRLGRASSHAPASRGGRLGNFVPRLRAGERYKFAILGRDGGRTAVQGRSDGRARRRRRRRRPSDRRRALSPCLARRRMDGLARAARQATDAPLSIYEVHRFRGCGRTAGRSTGDEAAERAAHAYARALGFTHVELPIAEYPFGGSWAYQPLSLLPTDPGDPQGFALRRRLPCAGNRRHPRLGHHFPNDAHGLVRFDGDDASTNTPIRRRAGIPTGTRSSTISAGARSGNFLIASAPAVGRGFSYRRPARRRRSPPCSIAISRREGEWRPNIYGSGRGNLGHRLPARHQFDHRRAQSRRHHHRRRIDRMARRHRAGREGTAWISPTNGTWAG